MSHHGGTPDSAAATQARESASENIFFMDEAITTLDQFFQPSGAALQGHRLFAEGTTWLSFCCVFIPVRPALISIPHLFKLCLATISRLLCMMDGDSRAMHSLS